MSQNRYSEVLLFIHQLILTYTSNFYVILISQCVISQYILFQIWIILTCDVDSDANKKIKELQNFEKEIIHNKVIVWNELNFATYKIDFVWKFIRSIFM